MLLLGKQQFAHTWNLFKTITGAAGLKPIRLNLHIWTQDIWGESKNNSVRHARALIGPWGERYGNPVSSCSKSNHVTVLLEEAISGKRSEGSDVRDVKWHIVKGSSRIFETQSLNWFYSRWGDSVIFPHTRSSVMVMTARKTNPSGWQESHFLCQDASFCEGCCLVS